MVITIKLLYFVNVQMINSTTDNMRIMFSRVYEGFIVSDNLTSAKEGSLKFDRRHEVHRNTK